MAIAGRVAIVPKGDWSADATYKRLDAVTYNNTLYFAKKEVPAGTATSNTEYWSKSIVGGAGAIATKEDAGIVKPTDGLSIAEDGTLKVNIDGATLTMDQVNNVIKLSDTLKDKINGAFPAANLINNLTTTEAGFGLDARQGKALDDKITEINGSLNNRLAVPTLVTTDTTTLSDIKNYINANMNTGLSYMQIFDAKCKFFNTSGNWLIMAFAQDRVSGCLLAVNHWSGEVKIISAYADPSGNKKLKISNVTITDTKDV
jgi:hypothetical protein|nr:MAG TPA: hypothetical protein [Caudoviricetes sp.]